MGVSKVTAIVKQWLRLKQLPKRGKIEGGGLSGKPELVKSGGILRKPCCVTPCFTCNVISLFCNYKFKKHDFFNWQFKKRLDTICPSCCCVALNCPLHGKDCGAAAISSIYATNVVQCAFRGVNPLVVFSVTAVVEQLLGSTVSGRMCGVILADYDRLLGMANCCSEPFFCENDVFGHFF